MTELSELYASEVDLLKKKDLAKEMQENGVKQKDIIGIMLNRSPEMIIGLIASGGWNGGTNRSTTTTTTTVNQNQNLSLTEHYNKHKNYIWNVVQEGVKLITTVAVSVVNLGITLPASIPVTL